MSVTATEPGILAPLLPALEPWLVTRRWFAGGGGPLAELAPVAVTVVREQSPALVHAVLRARHAGRPEQLYQLLLGLRPDLPARLAPSAIAKVPDGPWRGWTLYEAVEDPALLGVLLRTLALRDRTGGPRLERASALPLPVGLVPRALTAEQSNSTVAYGDRLLLKLYRRPEPGPHAEIDALRALTEQRCTRTPRLHGTLRTDAPGGEDLVLGLLEDFLPAEADGWESAVRHAADCIEGSCRTVPATGGFTAHARTLGQAVAEVHTALAEAFPRHLLGPGAVADDAAHMKRRLAEAIEEVPALARYRSALDALYEDYAARAARGCPTLAQRTHGDLHLGQALRTADGWRVIDFEGQPATPAAERTRPQSALRDVASMLRSFDYAARTALADVRERSADAGPGPRLRRTRRAYAWAARNRRAFCDGYRDPGGADPYCRPVPLRAFEADKAVYEAVYEARHRPALLPVPLAAIHRLAGSR
ncbi:maltokinase N-terminal cap-like domain-containing protein [Streptomyces sp. HUAS TT7]|uniref:maltokinase N-terminal cap-like domain-containing protein n=1 Tax=Streptomyces sp. HUAS TT7 TaxID=3447507 RepID=UPI003F6576BB